MRFTFFKKKYLEFQNTVFLYCFFEVKKKKKQQYEDIPMEVESEGNELTHARYHPKEAARYW
jgi:effector-binding domain-containing protein